MLTILVVAMHLSALDLYLTRMIPGFSYVALLGIIGLSILHALLAKRFQLYPNTQWLLLSMLLVNSCYGLSFIVSPPVNLSNAAFPWFHLMWLIILFSWFGEVSLNTVQRCCWIGLGFITLSVWGDVAQPGLFSNLDYRAAGFAGDANDGARAVVFSLAGVLLCRDSRSGLRWFESAAVLFTLFTVLATASRSGLLLYLLVIMGFYSMISFRAKLAFVLSGVLFVLVAWQFSLSDNINSRALDRLSPSSQKELVGKDSSRLDVVFEYLEIIATNPLGIGREGNAEREVNAHNTLLNIGAEAGLLAALGLLMVLGCLASLTRIFPLSLWGSLMLVNIGVVFSTSNVWYSRSWLMFIAIMVAAVIHQTNNNRRMN
ncbi:MULTISPECIES: O-antigen ligase family protein [unclassified Agarivorans]|uniref:O-antigen ligase family protein n=1 Tax=unclassified Agarivorans TaxID=2636026 RepID=UPI0026E35257|nr:MULTISPECIES: O-antigen ligase family protein [unclassified Agarivorans]MDO6686282.1 O-antigen ligase family protein [Agarivorans sp. 3_MG-2023]MDO6716269.1 O-antigen ligase family protein [Agarivorans sp. 2_MG-2023]